MCVYCEERQREMCSRWNYGPHTLCVCVCVRVLCDVLIAPERNIRMGNLLDFVKGHGIWLDSIATIF